MNRPPIHVLDYGDFGVGKTTFAATFPKPILAWVFDPRGKETPYLKLGRNVEVDSFTTDVFDKEDNLLVRVERYIDSNPQKPLAYEQFLVRMTTFEDEWDMWTTAVLDSVTFCEIAARYQEKYVLNPKSKDPRQWWAGSTDRMEEMLQVRFGAFPMNVVVICHVDRQKDEVNGTFVRVPSAPGRLTKGLPTAFAEVYRSYAARDEQGKRVYLLQTQGDLMYSAETHIDAADPSYADYNELWYNYDAAQK